MESFNHYFKHLFSPQGQSHLLMETSIKGNTRKGEFNGQRILTSFDGDKYVGEFKGGNFWNGTTYEIDGNFFGKLVNGKLKVK